MTICKKAVIDKKKPGHPFESFPAKSLSFITPAIVRSCTPALLFIIYRM